MKKVMEEGEKKSGFGSLSCFGSAICAIIGAFLCGFAAAYGAMATGLREGGWGFQFIPFLIGGWLLGIVFALIAFGVSLELMKCRPQMMFLPLGVPPLLVYFCGAIAFPVLSHVEKQQEIENRKQHEYAAAESLRLHSLLCSDPEIGIREKWYLEYNLRGGEFMKSLSDPSVHYTPEQLQRLYAESPRAREELFRHPACTTEFLVAHFQEAFDRSFNINYEMLASIVSNPNTPRELVEKVATSNKIPIGAVDPAKERLKIMDDKAKSPNKRE